MSSFIEFKEKLIKYGLEYFNLYYGNYEGVVVDCVDKEKRGRLKVKCPKVWGEKEKNIWVLPKGIYAGAKSGMHFMPKKGDTVWIEFEHGDPDHPIWNYGWWLKDKAIELAGEDKYVLCTPKGHVLMFDEKDETVFIKFKDGKAIQVDKDHVNLGTETGAKEPAVLGDKNEAVLKKLAGAVKSICEAFGTAGVTPMDGGATFKAALVAATTSIISDMAMVDANEAKETKSEVVMLD